MAPGMKNAFHSLPLLILMVQVSWQVCVDLPSDTEAVLGRSMKLTCISCMQREDVKAETQVTWYYVLNNSSLPIFRFNGTPHELDERWRGRLMWNGSRDLQEVSISIVNVMLNDSGKYLCKVFRHFDFNSYTPSFSYETFIELVVKDKPSTDITALYSEYMMYAVLTFFTLWLLVEMVYCYRKIHKADKQAKKNRTDI